VGAPSPAPKFPPSFKLIVANRTQFMAFSAGVCGRQELNMHLPVKCCPRSFGIASNSRFKLFLDTINLRVRSSLIAIEMTRFYSHFRYAGESSILFSTHVMVCGRVPERLCYVWIKRYLLVWIKPYPNHHHQPKRRASGQERHLLKRALKPIFRNKEKTMTDWQTLFMGARA